MWKENVICERFIFCVTSFHVKNGPLIRSPLTETKPLFFTAFRELPFLLRLTVVSLPTVTSVIRSGHPCLRMIELHLRRADRLCNHDCCRQPVASPTASILLTLRSLKNIILAHHIYIFAYCITAIKQKRPRRGREVADPFFLLLVGSSFQSDEAL